jgi:hypothetical protein
VDKQAAAKTIAILKARRDLLPAAADEIYLRLAKEVIVAGSDEEEFFEIKRLPSGETVVEIFRGDEKDKKPFYSRTFKPDETKEINLYCLGGNDEILITGEAKKSIDLNVYGGEGEDELDDRSKIASSGKATQVYDTWRGIIIEPSKEVKRHRSRSVKIHAFDREGL